MRPLGWGTPARTSCHRTRSSIERIEALIDFEHIGREVRQAFDTLHSDQREALRLRVIEGRSYCDVARALGCGAYKLPGDTFVVALWGSPVGADPLIRRMAVAVNGERWLWTSGVSGRVRRHVPAALRPSLACVRDRLWAH